MSEKQKVVKVGVIGGGLMGREVASAFGRWCSLVDFPVKPILTAVCDLNPGVLSWFEQVDSVSLLTADYHELLASDEVDVVYVAVPHNLHEKLYTDVVNAGKDMLGEKPFGIDLATAERLQKTVTESGQFVRCSSEFPFLPGAQRVVDYIRSGKCGQIMEMQVGFHHSSDMNQEKPINWKRQNSTCGEIGVMGDLGMHVMHIPLRLGFYPQSLFAQLQNICLERPDGKGNRVPCETWDNAILHGTIEHDGYSFPLRYETKRMAPTETNTWFIEALGTEGGVRFSTKEPKTLWTFDNDKNQSWRKEDLGFEVPFKTITGGIFEVGFPDILQQMWAAFFLEREGLLESKFGCVTVEEAVQSHRIFDAALTAQKEQKVVQL